MRNAVGTQPAKTIAKKIPAMIQKTEIRPGQLIARSTPWRSPYSARQSIASSRAARTSRAQRGSSSKRQQTTAPESIVRRSMKGSIRAPMRLYWPVRAGEEAVEVVAGGDQPEDDRRRGRAPVAGFE